MRQSWIAPWCVPLVLTAASMPVLTLAVVFAVDVLTANELATAPPGAWRTSLADFGAALARQDFPAAKRLNRRALAAALSSRDWEGMLEAGDAYVRLGRETRGLDTTSLARQAYLQALLHARRRGSLDGVLLAAEAFAALGDAEVVEQSIRIATRVAVQGADPLGPERVRRFAQRWAADRTRPAEPRRADHRPATP